MFRDRRSRLVILHFFIFKSQFCLSNLRFAMFRRLAQICSLIRQGQFFLLFQAITSVILPASRFATKKTVFFRLHRSDTQVDSPLSKGVECFRGDEADVRRMVDDLYDEDPVALDFYRAYLREGVEPWLARDLSDGRILGVVWLYTGSYLSAWEGYDAWLLDVRVEPMAKFVANVYVAPECRGRGIFPQIMQRCLAEYTVEANGNDPVVEFYSCIDQANTVSIRSHEKIGFRPCAATYYVRIFQRTRCLFLRKKGQWRGLCRGQWCWIKFRQGVAVQVELHD